MSEKIVWFASGGGISRMGPYATQVAAWEALRLTESLARSTGYIHPVDAKVWPEAGCGCATGGV